MACRRSRAGDIHGWVFERPASTFFSTALSVCQTLDLHEVFVTTNPEDVPSELATSVRHETYVPFGLLLPRSRALVSHGGIGACAQALAAGIPHLVAHSAFDQRDNGSRLEDLGVGSSIPASKFRGRRAMHAVSSVLEKSLKTEARELSMRVDRLSALDATCREIEAIATR